MALKVWISDKPFSHTRENEMISSVIKNLEAVLGQVQETVHLLCNFSIPGNTKRYVSSLDLAILRQRHLTILELKNYRGPLSGAPEGAWTCETEGGLVVIQGGKSGRNPMGQVSDYHEQMTKLLKRRLNPMMREPFDKNELKHLVSAFLVFPDTEWKETDHLYFEPEKFSWLKVLRIHELPRAILERSNDSKKSLTPRQMALIVGEILQLKEAFLVDGFPMVKAGAQKPTPEDFGAKPGDPEEDPMPRKERPAKKSRDDSAPKSDNQSKREKGKKTKGRPPAALYEDLWKLWRSNKESLAKFTACCEILTKLIEPHAQELIRTKKARNLQGSLPILFKDEDFLSQKLPNIHSIHVNVRKGKVPKIKTATLRWTFEATCRAIVFLQGAPIPRNFSSIFAIPEGMAGDTAATDKAVREGTEETRDNAGQPTSKRKPLRGRAPYNRLRNIWRSRREGRQKVVLVGTVLEETLDAMIQRELRAGKTSDSDEAFYQIFQEAPALLESFQGILPVLADADDPESDSTIDDETLAKVFSIACEIAEFAYRIRIPRDLARMVSPTQTEPGEEAPEDTEETATSVEEAPQPQTGEKTEKAPETPETPAATPEPATPVATVAPVEPAPETTEAKPKTTAKPKAKKATVAKAAEEKTSTIDAKPKTPAKAKAKKAPAKVEKTAEPKDETTEVKPKATAKAKAKKTTVEKTAEEKTATTGAKPKTPAKAKAKKATVAKTAEEKTVTIEAKPKATAKAKKPQAAAKVVPIPEDYLKGLETLLASHKANGQKLKQLWDLMDGIPRPKATARKVPAGLREAFDDLDGQRATIEKEKPSRLPSAEVQKALQSAGRILELHFASPLPEALRTAFGK